MKFFLAYGTLYDYCLISVEELSTSFSSTTSGSFNFSLPHVKNEDLDLSTVNALRKKIKYYSNIVQDPYLPRLMAKIEIGLSYFSAIDKDTDRIIKRYNIASQDDKNAVCSWLEQLFLAGMYMRRWTGPPEPYPMSESSTERKDIDPNSLTIPVLEKMDTMLKEMNSRPRDLISELKIVEWQRNKRTWEDITANTLAKELYHGNRCIRQYSTFCIGTGYHWILLFTKNNVGGNNFHPKDLAQILHEP